MLRLSVFDHDLGNPNGCRQGHAVRVFEVALSVAKRCEDRWALNFRAKSNFPILDEAHSGEVQFVAAIEPTSVLLHEETRSSIVNGKYFQECGK